MSEERRPQRPGGPGPMGFMGRGAMGMPVQKAKNLRGPLVRLLGYFMPHKYRLLAVIVAAVLSTIFTIVGPKILGLATTKLFQGIVLKMEGVPGAGGDFTYIAHILLILAGLYIISSGFNYIQQYMMAAVAQDTVYTIRQKVEEEFERLSLKFFDSRTHGQ